MKMKFVASGIVLIAASAIGFGIVRGASPGESVGVHIDVSHTSNSCAVHCPAKSAYPSLVGSVECAEGHTPACQCRDPKQKMAYCERQQ